MYIYNELSDFMYVTTYTKETQTTHTKEKEQTKKETKKIVYLPEVPQNSFGRSFCTIQLQVPQNSFGRSFCTILALELIKNRIIIFTNFETKVDHVYFPAFFPIY